MYDKINNNQCEKGERSFMPEFFALFFLFFHFFWALFCFAYSTIAVILFGEEYSHIIMTIAIISSFVCATGACYFLHKLNKNNK
jgi:hypothetical protein